jgi:ribosomal protein S12 methylthiotransferase accessory factor YcaO
LNNNMHNQEMHTQYRENGNQHRQKKLVHLHPELMLRTRGCLLLSKTHEITWTRHERLSHGRKMYLNNNWQMMTSNQTKQFGKESCIT